MKTIKLFIVDDSATVRQSISKLVEDENDIEILGVASDPIFAMNKFKKLGKPDVLILDIEMPKMDGLTFLKQIMSEDPIPTIICSAITKSGDSKSIEALHFGAIEVIEKPNIQTKAFFEKSKEILLNSIRIASKAKVRKISNNKIITANITKTNILEKKTPSIGNKKAIAIGSSTGGVQVIEKILVALPASTVPILITQHMPANFTNSFSKRLNSLSKITVKEAVDKEKVKASTAYIAPGDKHMLIQKVGLNYTISIQDGPKISHHRPSVDVLFRSFANEVGRSGVGIILTGMGSDGSHGMKEMFDAGAKTYAQDEKSCVVYGMPNEAVKLGGVTKSLDIEKIIELIQTIK